MIDYEICAEIKFSLEDYYDQGITKEEAKTAGNVGVKKSAAVEAAVAPVIDGKLDDAVWKTAFRMTNFKTFEPDYSKEPKEKTEAFMMYDSENFYFGFRCYDKEPKKIKASITKRDNMFDDDFIGVIIDTFNDKQSGYGFMVNPFGIQGDGMMNIQGNFETIRNFTIFNIRN